MSKPARPHPKTPDTHKWDWQLNNPTLALIHGVSRATVRHLRSVHAPKTRHRTGRPERSTSFDFSGITDWSRGDTDIAREVGCSPGTVYHYRRAHDLPRAVRKPGSGRRPKYRWARLDPSKTIKENAKRVGGASIAATWEQMQKLQLRGKGGAK